MNEELSRLFPTLMRLLAGSSIATDLEKAKPCFGTADPVECVHEKRSKGDFASGLMTYHLCAALGMDQWFDPLVPHIEADLGKLSACVRRFDDLVGGFRRKLLNDKEFDDVVYEIAAAAMFGDILDGGRVALEEPLDESTKKNPDVTGAWSGRRTRAEVTVVHDDWPPRYSHEAQQVVESADVPGGYTATLNVPLTEKTDAGRIKTMIEKLFAARLTTERKVTVDGFEFSYRGNEFRSGSVKCPINYVEFHDLEFRSVQGVACERSTVTDVEESDLEERFPQPKGMVTTADLEKNPAAHCATPIGEKIYRTLERKMLKQCEPGAVNVIVLGQPMPPNDKGVDDALFGSGVALVPLLETSGSTTRETPAVFARTGLGPFTDLSRLEPDQAAALQGEVDRFKRVSAVLVLRLDGSYPLARVIRNPNADQPLSPQDCERLGQVALARAGRKCSRPQAGGDKGGE
jgi:hypothetical protein